MSGVLLLSPTKNPSAEWQLFSRFSLSTFANSTIKKESTIYTVLNYLLTHSLIDSYAHTHTTMKLTHFLMKLTNETVQVELKDGSIVQGSIVTVSPTMNISLKKCKMTLKHRDPQVVDFINIRGNNVRNVILPDSLNLDLLLQGGGSTIKRKRRASVSTDSTKRVRRAL